MISMTKQTFEELMDTATNKGAKLQFDVGQLQQKLQETEKERDELKTQLDSIIQAKMQENSSKVPVSNLAGEKK